eukprot:2169028-Pyramimonas_sp.AAC.1
MQLALLPEMRGQPGELETLLRLEDPLQQVAGVGGARADPLARPVARERRGMPALAHLPQHHLHDGGELPRVGRQA